MIKIFIVIFAAIFFISSSFAADQYTVIKNVNIFTGEKHLKNTDFVFHKNKIISIGLNIGSYPNAIVIEGKGFTIIPPLGNAHVHISNEENLKTSLAAGIFINIDMYGSDESSKHFRTFKDSLYYSDFYSPNSGATVPKGHGTGYGMKVPTVDEKTSAAQFVRDRIAGGADFIKIISEPLRKTLSSEQTLEIITETHNHDKIAVAHVSRLKNANELAEQNIDGFAHIWFNNAATDENLDLIKEKNIFVIPTLSVYGNVLKRGEKEGWAKYYLPFQGILDEVTKLYKKDILILSGTDAPNHKMNYTTQLFDEMILLSKAGLSNEVVMKSATTNIYKAFSLTKYDELKIGGTASFILVKGNPLVNIKDIKNNKRIFKEGTEISAPSISQ